MLMPCHYASDDITYADMPVGAICYAMPLRLSARRGAIAGGTRLLLRCFMLGRRAARGVIGMLLRYAS